MSSLGPRYAAGVASDRDQIAELISTYAERIDTGDFVGVADLFAEAEMTFAGSDHVVRGRRAVLDLYTTSTRRYDDGTPKTKHVMTNLIVDLDGDCATTRSYFTVLQAVPGALALQPVVAGRYHNRFARVEGGWRFDRVHIIIDLMGDLGHHMLFNLRAPE